MPVDTRNKRASAIGFVLPSRVVYPNPSGSLATAALRVQIAYSYAGIVPAAFTLIPDGRTADGAALGTRTATGSNLGTRTANGRGPN